MRDNNLPRYLLRIQYKKLRLIKILCMKGILTSPGRKLAVKNFRAVVDVVGFWYLTARTGSPEKHLVDVDGRDLWPSSGLRSAAGYDTEHSWVTRLVQLCGDDSGWLARKPCREPGVVATIHSTVTWENRRSFFLAFFLVREWQHQCRACT